MGPLCISRCIDCIHFDKEKVKEGQFRRKKTYLYGCRKRKTGYVHAYVLNIRDLSLYDNMLGCFEPGGQQTFLND